MPRFRDRQVAANFAPKLSRIGLEVRIETCESAMGSDATIVSSRAGGALMIWTAKEVSSGVCARDLNQLEKKHLELGGPPE